MLVCVCVVCFPPRVRSFELCAGRCNLERPSELSWRARHGRKKKAAAGRLNLNLEQRVKQGHRKNLQQLYSRDDA